MRETMKSKAGAIVAAALMSASLLAGCGSSSPGADESGNSKLPGGKDTLVVGTSVGAPPYEFYEGSNTEVLGYEPELLKAAADVLGAKVQFQVADYTALFGGLDAKRYDLVAFGLVDRKARQEK
jgi:ABC-type amino acid transport substrate-binding protein